MITVADGGIADRTRDWTVMVFMTSDSDLELYADVDLQEMQKVGSTAAMNVVVQLARSGYDSPVRFQIKKGNREAVSKPAGPKNSGDPRVLSGFLDWVLHEYSAQKYFLILWGHAFGVGFGRVRGNALTIVELAKVLTDFAAKLPGQKLQLLGCDTCSMSKAEGVYQLRGCVDYLVASQTSMPYAGWPYERILSRIDGNPGLTARALGEHIVQDFIASYKPPQIALALLNLDQAEDLKNAIRDLADALLVKLKEPTNREWVVDAFDRASSGAERALIDLGDFCEKLQATTQDLQVRNAARAVLEALPEAVVVQKTSPVNSDFHGLGIYAPLVASPSDWESLDIWRDGYEDLDLMKATQWDKLVYGFRPRRFEVR